MADRLTWRLTLRGAAVCLAAGLATMAVLGCGKTNPTAASSGSTSSASGGASTSPQSGAQAKPPTGAPAPGGQGGALSQARASAFASAVNLRAADVPGFAPSGEAQGGGLAPNKPLERRLARCTGALGGAHGGPEEHSSPEFARARNALGERVSSSVSFVASEANVPAELTALRSAHTRACLSSYLQALLRGRRFGGASVARVTIVQGTPPAPGSSGGFGWRVTAVATAGRLAVPFYLDILGFVYRRAEVTLLSSGAVLPFPAAIEERLYQLLLSRATAHKL
jgi:hypothetical protein